MSLALDFLTELFARDGGLSRGEFTQTDFARSAGMTPTNVTDILKGDVAISARNMGKLLRGLRNEKERLDFLSAYLRDQVPSEYADDIAIRVTAPSSVGGTLEDVDDASALETQMILAFTSLPSDLYRRRTVMFLQQLRKDADFRDLFARTMAYLEEEKGSGLSPDTLKSTLTTGAIAAAGAASERSAKRALKKGRRRNTPPPPTQSAPEKDAPAKR